jgi:hypothetical protein
MADTTTRIGTNVVGVEALQHSLRVTPDSSSITGWVPITEPMKVGENLADVTVHVLCENYDQYFAGTFRLGLSYDKHAWFTPAANVVDVQCDAADSSAKYVVSSAYSTRTDFGRWIRLEMGLYRHTENAGVKKGCVSVAMALRFLS